LAPSSASQFLDKVTRIIQKRSLHSAKVDWKSVKIKSLEIANEAKSTDDTYPAINYILSQTGDHHSFLTTRKGERVFSPSMRTNPALRPRISRNGVVVDNDKKFGFIHVSGLNSGGEKAGSTDYARSLQQQILECAAQKPLGWIIDLRGNRGGNMWPMIAGIGPVLGASTIGFFQYQKTAVPWFYENGKAGVIDRFLGKITNFKLENSIPDCEQAPVVVLIDEATASSGEALTICFKGREQTCFIGKPTRGLSTNNETIPLPDGATLYLTTSGETDRNHTLYDSGVVPDILVEQGNFALGASDDPAIEMAIKWLSNFVEKTEIREKRDGS